MTPDVGAAKFEHEPVLLDAVVDGFAPVPAGLVLDATVGGAGHAAALLSAHPHLQVLGLDVDALAVDAARRRLAPFGERARVIRARFDQITEMTLGERPVGVLFDLGVSSMQLDVGSRGFSYRLDGMLDMRMDDRRELDAAAVVNQYPLDQLARLLAVYGDERYAGRISRAIGRARPIETTVRLAEVVRDAIPAAARREGGHPARRTFQAIRIEVNQELDVLRPALRAAFERVVPGGRALILSYHSGEDRIVKDELRRMTRPAVGPAGLPVEPEPAPARLLYPRSVTPDTAEQCANPRSRSARLRGLEILVRPEA